MTANSPASRTPLWGIALVAGLLALVYALSAILMPFVLGTLLAYICHPLAQRLTCRWFPRALAALAVLLLLTGLAVLFGVVVVPLLAQEVHTVLARLPQAALDFRRWATPLLQDNFGLGLDDTLNQARDLVLQNLGATETALQRVVFSAGQGGAFLLGLLTTLLLTPVVMFYLLKDWDRLLPPLGRAIPLRYRNPVFSLAREIDAMLGQFLRGQLLVMAVMATFYAVGLRLAGLEAGLALGTLTGLLVFVPYLGVLTGFLLALLSALIQAPLQSGLLLPVVGVYLLGHVLEGTLVTPRLVGERIGLHPVAVIFALMAFGKLLGLFGVIIALPATAILWVVVRHLTAARRAAEEPA